MIITSGFRSTGSYEPDLLPLHSISRLLVFRSTGSYEPDRFHPVYDFCPGKGFDPQALTSLTFLFTTIWGTSSGFDPQALTSLTFIAYLSS